MVAVVALAAAFYGLRFDPAATNVATKSRIYPISPVAYTMVQPDGQKRLFELTDAKEGVLSGPKPWLGVLKGSRIDIWADPACTGGKLRTAFTFVNGRLRLMVLDGKKYTFAKGGGTDWDLDELFPEQKKRSYEKGSSADIWRNSSRLKLWFTNPNSAGTFCALVALLGLWLLQSGLGVWRLHGLLVMACGLMCTAQSGSRCAVLGFVVGAGLEMVFFLKRHLNVRSLAIILLAASALIGGVAVSGMADRFTDTVRQVDSGNQRRLAVAKAAVQMFADAPFGWRGGEVPGRNAALNFYIFDDDHVIRTHLLSVTELGWFAGFFYIAFWVLMLAVAGVCAWRGNALGAALWTAFGVAGCFNPVYIDWEVWVLPILSLVILLLPRYRLSAKAWMTCVAVASSVSALTVCGLALTGKAMERPTKTAVRSCGKATFINGESPRTWIVGDPLVMAGYGFPGREILAHCVRHPQTKPIAYVYAVEDLPSEADRVIVAGRNVPDYLEAYARGCACKAKRLILLSPSVSPDKVPAELVRGGNAVWIAGSLLAARDAAYENRRTWVKVIPGCERYIPNWLELFL